MSGYGTSDDTRPLLWLRGYPLFATHLIVLVLVLSMIATTALMAFGGSALLETLGFTSARVLGGEVWRVLTYGLVNPPSLWFAIDMLLVVWFGRELERELGRRNFLWLCLGLYLAPVLLLTLAGGFGLATSLSGQGGGFGLFIAFATLYPGALMLFNLQARWVALILVGLYALIGLGQRDVAGLISLVATAGFAYLCVRQLRGSELFPWWPKAKPRPRPASTAPSRGTAAKVVPFPAATTSPAPRPATTPADKPAVARVPLADMAEVDALLDKIAHSGISSLTAAERARLDAAHQSLKRRSSSELP
jgi:membrane associated rhomboid family serine protease